MTTEKNQERIEETQASLERAMGNLLEVGRLWASHGLSIGRAALETSAETLRVTADTLADFHEKLDEKGDREDRAA